MNLPPDVLRTILHYSIYDSTWDEIEAIINNLFNTCLYFREFITKDKLFWKELYSYIGLNLVEVENYYLYFTERRWVEYFYYPGLDYTKWGHVCFLHEDLETVTVFPYSLQVSLKDYCISNPYLAMRRGERILIYMDTFDEEHIVAEIPMITNASFYIRATILGLILGYSIYPNVWKVILLKDGTVEKLSLLKYICPTDIFTCGYYVHGQYYRFDYSPLTSREHVFFNMDERSYIFQSEYPNLIFLLLGNTIKYYDSHTGEEIKNHVFIEPLIYNRDRTKVIWLTN